MVASRRCVAALVVACLAASAVLASATRASYDPQFARQMVQYSAAAYCAANKLSNWSCEFCTTSGFNVTRVVTNTEYNLQGFVGYDKNTDTIVIAYRGTQGASLKNWILNLEGSKTRTAYPHCACSVEDGFYTGHKALEPLVSPTLRYLKDLHPSARVYVTGHSLGAALAVLSAAHIQSQEGINVDAINVFGLPRVGDLAFSQWYNSILPNAVHVTHYHDIVPHVPPESFGYHHTPTEVWYNTESGSSYTVCDGTGEDASCADSVSFYDFSISDHLHYLGVAITSCDPE